MAATTKIEWADATVNFWWGCTKVSAACDHCYAEAFARRLGKDLWGNGVPRAPRLEAAAREAFALDRKAAKQGRRLKVFSNSMADFFDSEVPDDWRDQAMAVIALTPNLDWRVLTKRPKVMRAYFTHDDGFGRWGYIEGMALHLAGRVPGAPKIPAGKTLANWGGRNLPNLWLGVTAEDQKMADLRIPELLATPAAKRFVSCEPLLGPVDLRNLRQYNPRGAPWIDALRGLVTRGDYLARSPAECCFNTSTQIPGELPSLDQVICGGESGPKARPSHPDWFRALRDQCVDVEVPFFFKQWGEWAPRSCDDPEVFSATFGEFHGGRDFIVGCCCREGDAESAMFRVGKKAAGRLLDGAIWDQQP